MLVSFVPPGGGSASVGLLSADGGRVADLTAIGMEDVFAALPRFGQLERLVKHLTATPGAVTYAVGSVRLLAPVPYARLVRQVAVPVPDGGEGAALAFADPRELAGPGARVTVTGSEVLAVGIVGAIGTGGRDIAPGHGGSHLAGVTVFAEWRSSDPDATVANDRLVLGPALASMSSLADDAELLVTLPHESVRRIPLAGALAALGSAVSAASSRYTLRVGDLFIHDAGVVDSPLEPGATAEITVDGPGGTLSHVALRSG